MSVLILCPFFNQVTLLFCCWGVWTPNILGIVTPYQIHDVQIFFPSLYVGSSLLVHWLRLHSSLPGFDPWSGKQDPSCIPQCGQRKENIYTLPFYLVFWHDCICYITLKTLNCILINSKTLNPISYLLLQTICLYTVKSKVY